METSTNYELLRIMFYIAIIVSCTFLIIWLFRKQSYKSQIDKSDLDPAVVKILRLKKKRSIYTALAVIVWIGLFVFLLLKLNVSPKFGDIALCSYVSYYLMTGPWQGNKMILWLRRFHVKHYKPLQFHQMLSFVSRGYGIPITIQDSTLKTSFNMVAGQVIKRQPFLVLWIVAIAMMLNYLPAYYLSLLLPACFVLMFFLISYWYLSGKLGYLALKEKYATDSVSDLLSRINKRRTSFMSGITIIKCKDVFWKKIVELGLKYASVVVVDVTELTDNLMWELQTALRIMRPENIILTCSVNNNDKTMPVKVHEELELLLGKERLDKCQIFFYPASRTQLSQRNGWLKLAQELSIAIAVGLAHTREVGEPFLHCPNCGSPYHLSDYRMDAEKIICSYCNKELPRLDPIAIN